MYVESRTQTPVKKSKKIKDDRKKSEVIRLESCYVENISDVEILYISPLTQIFVGCRIGQEITVINPWVYVKKEKILDHLEFYAEESEFHQIEDVITSFPLDEIMIGSCNFNSSIPVDFYICKTKQAQKNIENTMKIKNEMLFQKILNSIYPISRNWESLGSEEQIKNELNFNNRSLLAVDIESDFPIHKGTTYFKMNLAEEILDGYIELRSGKPVEMRFLWRRRIDKATQITPLKTSISIQTQEHPCLPQMTQYNYKCVSQLKLTKKQIQDLENFLNTTLNFLCDRLLVNYHLNLYQNDYSNLKKRTSPIVFRKPHDIKLYQDINFRRNKVSCMSWNAIISGVVAAAYSRNPLLCVSKRIHVGEVKDPSTENHMILIWYYKDNVRPKLYLHAKSEVTALSFCPYDENILVAGYSNGLVAVWDLTDRLVDAETPTFLTDREQHYHSFILNKTSWIKRPLGLDHIFPVLTSEFQIGHTSPVTSIAWLPPTHHISDMRQYEECEDGEKHMQFLTISLDGNKILVWDLNPQHQEFSHRKVGAKTSRLTAIPEALTQNISPLQELQASFKPVCKLYVSIPKSQNNNNPLIKMVMKNEMYHYTPINPNTLGDLDAVTYFTTNKLRFTFDTSRRIIFTTGLGFLQIAFWEGASYKGESREEVCRIDTLEMVHDGPILVCEINPFFPDMVMTVGGSVFAIWDCSKTRNALVWRKSGFRYQSGMWCLYQPLSLLVIRVDRCFEFWNIVERSNTPVELFKYKGYDLMKFYGDSTKYHVRKQTFITTDALGAFRVFSFPSDVKSKTDEDLIKAMEYINRIYERKRYLEELKEKCRLKIQLKAAEDIVSNFQESVKEVQVPVEVEEEKPPKPVKISNKVRFEQNLEKYMRKMEISRKRLNMAQIKRDTLICLKTQVNKAFGFREKQINPEETLQTAKNGIFENNILTNKVTRRIEVTISKEKALYLKKMYMDSFHEIEHEIVDVIKNKNYSLKTKFIDLRRKFENMAHSEMRHLKRKVIVETEADVIHMNIHSVASLW